MYILMYRIRVISLSITTNIHHFFVVRIFQIPLLIYLEISFMLLLIIVHLLCNRSSEHKFVAKEHSEYL
jgi:hypothetical protein